MSDRKDRTVFILISFFSVITCKTILVCLSYNTCFLINCNFLLKNIKSELCNHNRTTKTFSIKLWLYKKNSFFILSCYHLPGAVMRKSIQIDFIIHIADILVGKSALA